MPYTGGLTQEEYERLPVRGGRWAATHSADQGLGEFRVPLCNPGKRGPEQEWNYFHPGRADARLAPEWFRAKVKEIDERLEVVWHPVHERWTVWCRSPRHQFWMCPGWQLIFPWTNPANGAYLPLDERLIANIYGRSPKVWGRAIDYWNRIESEVLRDKERKERARQQEVRDMAADQFDSAQIKVSMRGKSNGSKFADHHAE